jgi:hypothetical protein
MLEWPRFWLKTRAISNAVDAEHQTTASSSAALHGTRIRMAKTANRIVVLVVFCMSNNRKASTRLESTTKIPE